MIQTKNNTSIALKIYSVIVLFNSIISLVTSIKTAFFSNSAIPLHYLFTAESLASVIVIGILVININKDKNSAALFLPCLTYSIVLVLVLAIFIGVVTPGLYNLKNTSSWNVILAGIFLWIALDSRKGLKYPLAELIILAAFHVLNNATRINQYVYNNAQPWNKYGGYHAKCNKQYIIPVLFVQPPCYFLSVANYSLAQTLYSIYAGASAVSGGRQRKYKIIGYQ